MIIKLKNPYYYHLCTHDSYPLIINGTAPTEADYVALQYRLWRLRPRTRLAGWAVTLWLALVSYFVVRDGLTHHALTDYYTAAILVIGLGVAFARRPLVRRQLRRAYARPPALRSLTRFELRPEGLRGQGQLSAIESRWAGLLHAQRLGPWLLLYITEATCYYLDLRHLQPPATEADVRALLQAQGVAVKS